MRQKAIDPDKLHEEAQAHQQQATARVAPSSSEPPAPAPWWESPPTTLEEATALLELRARWLRHSGPEGIALRKLLEWVEQAFAEQQQQIHDLWPLASFKPSYEQSLLLNAWWCGVDFPVCFSANRIGKTAAFVVNGILWIFPNNPQWECFSAKTLPRQAEGLPLQPNPHADQRFYLDHLGRPVQLLPRPFLANLQLLRNKLRTHPHLAPDPAQSHLEGTNKDKWRKLRALCPEVFDQSAWPQAPLMDPSNEGTLWLGAPDRDYHKDIILKEWKRWLPRQSIINLSENDLTIKLTTRESTNPRSHRWNVICKSYESEDTKWSGAAVHGIILTEGLTLATFNEVRQRIKAGGFASWDYTPYESANTGAKTALAQKVFKGEEELPLTAHVFTRFSARNAPNHVLPAVKRADLIRIWEGKKEGQARLDGEFYSSSPLLLSSFDRRFHTLPWTRHKLFEEFPTGQLYRSLDPGYDHPASACWGVLTPNNEWFIYRFYTKRNTTIAERCEDIIKLSGNESKEIRPHPKARQTIKREFHTRPFSEVFSATVADFHLFKTDERSGAPYVLNYTQEGLVLTESTHMRPKDRVMELDRMLSPSKYITHPLTKQTPGARVYFLINEEGVDPALKKMESLYWERLHSGPHKGEAKDEVPTHGDDELDALCYLVCSGFAWNNHRPRPNNHWVDPADNELANLQLTTH